MSKDTNMIPPEATQAGQGARAGETPPAVSLCPIERIRNRADFLRANRGRRQVTAGFILLARKRITDEGSPSVMRVGFTCSRKLGNAVRRNRAKRRLREAARLVLPGHGRCGWDYVLIGKPESTRSLPFDHLVRDLRIALDRLHARKR